MTQKHLLDQVIKHRRALHQIPEIGFDLYKTHAYVKEQLIMMGYDPKTYAQTGLVAVKQGLSSEAIAFRSDMDGLQVMEKTDISFQSLIKNQMHACGHDGHMAMLLTFAEYVSKLEGVKKTLVFIFQPAEEGPGGAEVIIKEGLFEVYDIKSIFGFHLYPDLKEGQIGLVRGPMMAQNGEFDIVIQGKSSHGAQPQQGIDALVVAASLITQYQSIVSRLLDPLIPSVITIGTIAGGEARNIIAQTISLTGTIRTFNTKEYKQIKTNVNRINQSLELAYGVTIDCTIRDFYPPVINDSDLYDHAKFIFEEDEYTRIKPMMFAEDFAFYQQKVSGLFMMLGTRNEALGYTSPLHSCYFNFNDHVLIKGINAYVRIAQSLDVF